MRETFVLAVKEGACVRALVPRARAGAGVVRACAFCLLSEGIVGFIPLWRTVTTRESCSHTGSSW